MPKGKPYLYVYSTMSADVIYRTFQASAGDVPVPAEGVLIKGGANVQDGRLETPRGVATRIDADLYPILESDPVFQAHKANGYITVSEAEADPEAVASEMENRDASAPLQPGDFEAKTDKDGVVTSPTPTQNGETSGNKRKA